jgi:EAL domain-containing protein (putative c-di-GMP-specific phosphodiesterase class I)
MVGPDPQRQQRLAQHYLNNSESATHLSATLRLTAAALDFPRAQVNIFDDVVQHTISEYPPGEHTVTAPRGDSMCQFTLVDGLLAVNDLRLDHRARSLPGVLAGVARSYLGVALRSREGIAVGTLCVIDTIARDITAAQSERIRRFGDIAEDQLEVIRRGRTLHDAGQPTGTDLGTAIQQGEIVPWFQPVIDLGTNAVVGFEALARWIHEDGTVDPPARFIPLAEDSDLIIDLDRSMLAQSLAQLADWQKTRPSMRLAVNLSTRHLEIPDGVSTVHTTVLDNGISPAQVDIELTETRALAAEDDARRAVAELTKLGYGVLLDDFGNGWSSLEWLAGLPITGVKIDRAITNALGTPAGDTINQALSDLAGDIGLSVVVEGITTQDQAEQAYTLGYQRAQGYYWTAPLPADQMTSWLPDAESTPDRPPSL